MTFQFLIKFCGGLFFQFKLFQFKFVIKYFWPRRYTGSRGRGLTRLRASPI